MAFHESYDGLEDDYHTTNAILHRFIPISDILFSTTLRGEPNTYHNLRLLVQSCLQSEGDLRSIHGRTSDVMEHLLTQEDLVEDVIAACHDFGMRGGQISDASEQALSFCNNYLDDEEDFAEGFLKAKKERDKRVAMLWVALRTDLRELARKMAEAPDVAISKKWDRLREIGGLFPAQG
ncbi:hypothetical protein B0T14DRAFT_563352 [Immersiella caudata]|uniref:Uncharacterized protein n=1 Tax=Immersiella caudata TaxID=314043 RepID=A0AA40C776_9PEZI|nr:hypothetical protein B0T14DRAFT_563352 [Immersiella caudata]